MKRFILTVILASFIGLCFAQEGNNSQPAASPTADELAQATQSAISAQTPKSEKFNMELTLGFPVHSTSSPTPHGFAGAIATIDKSITANVALGYAMTFSLHEFVGWTLDTDFSFGNERTETSTPLSSSISLFGANVLFGPTFYLYKYHLFRIPLTLGAHMFYWDSNKWVPPLNAPITPGTQPAPGSGWLRTQNLQVGAGLSVGIHFYFTPNAYMISRANFAVDFYRWHKIQLSDGATIIDEAEKEMAIGWGVRPTIGLGMRF